VWRNWKPGWKKRASSLRTDADGIAQDPGHAPGFSLGARMIFMTHPEHGATNVLPHEVEAHKALGWSEDDPARVLAAKREANRREAQYRADVAFEIAHSDALLEAVEVKPKRGRPRKAQ
jgi:hypothetical protein